MNFTSRIFILAVFMVILVVQTDAKFFNDSVEDYADVDASAMNESLSMILLTKIKNSTKKPSSLPPILKVLFTKYKSLNKTHHHTSSTIFQNQSTSTSMTPQKKAMTAPPIEPYILAEYLVDQFNHYRNTDIVSRIKQCDSNMKLTDVCEIYSIDNHTYSVIRELNIEFQSLQHVYDALVDRMIVQKLNKLCPTTQWCLDNLTTNDIRFTIDILRQRGRSFCSLEKCHHRLAVQATSCPSISTRNISTPTLKLLPMLCNLYQEQQNWSSTECNKQLVYLLHILYAFWPQLETCYHIITAGSGGCTSECLAFDSILHRVEDQCNKNASFLTRVPALAWYRLINLQQICRHETIVTKPPFISSVQNFISSNMVWYRFHQRPVHVALFIIIIFCIVISFSLCLYIMSKNNNNANTRRFDDDYEYTRLHDSTFELGTNTEITDMDSASSRMINESPFDLNGNLRPSEHQRLI